jgi:NAD(P)-dependent dehydrogenase (short-subunit alcohol dehydrogenase family)
VEDFEGKVAVVTGAASGIGRAMADAFAGLGMRLVLADIEAGPLEDAAHELREAGADVFAVTADVSRVADVERVGAAAMDVHGALHVACNNAGVAGGGLSWEVDLSTWEWVHGLHVFTPLIIRSGGGHVVNTASMAGLTSTPGMSPYNASKHAVVTISESMHTELAMTHPEVGVSVLCPGWVRTKINVSERNRPGWIPPEDDEAGALNQMRKVVDGLIAEGLQPAAVANLVVEAIRHRRFWILTHPEWSDMVRDRTDRILSGEDPRMFLPGMGD